MIGYNFKSGGDRESCLHVDGEERTIVDVLRISGIVLQCLLLLFVFHNIYKYLYKPKGRSPMSLIIFYSASTVTIISLIVSLAVITNSTRQRLIIEWTSITVAEVGIQVIAISQACSEM